MERNDIPATLRGHRLVDLIELFLNKHFFDKDPFNNPHIRSALFGNLERIRDFHQDLLLPELERSKLRTSRIASIFLKYVSS